MNQFLEDEPLEEGPIWTEHSIDTMPIEPMKPVSVTKKRKSPTPYKNVLLSPPRM